MKYVVLFLCCVFAGQVFSQSNQDFFFFSPSLEAASVQVKNPAPATTIPQDKNEIQNLGIVLYSVYRNLISSQDGSPCRFYPTCSAYCRSAIRKNGLIVGTVQGIDRLTRCNGLSPHKYSVDIKRRKLVDHVQ